MPLFSSVILAIQGGFNFLNGAVNLLSFSVAAKNVEILATDSIPVIHTIALGLISLGTFYIIAAERRDRLTMWLTVVGRTIAAGIFTIDAGLWKYVAILEGFCGALLAGSLIWESRDGKGKEKKRGERELKAFKLVDTKTTPFKSPTPQAEILYFALHNPILILLAW